MTGECTREEVAGKVAGPSGLTRLGGLTSYGIQGVGGSLHDAFPAFNDGFHVRYGPLTKINQSGGNIFFRRTVFLTSNELGEDELQMDKMSYR